MDTKFVFSLLTAAVVVLCPNAYAGPLVTFDFETEDDQVTPLSHGQIVDPNFDAPGFSEFGNIFNLGSTQDGSDGHLGVTVFDSDRSAAVEPNDDDLLVGTGNILILQNDSHSSRTGDFYDSPNDEASLDDNGSIVFDFLFPLGPRSIDIVDANGGFGATVALTDINNLTRTFTIPEMWTTDVTVDPNGYQTLDLTSLAPQPSEFLAAGGDTTAVEDIGFDETMVVQLRVSFTGSGGGGATTSGGIDNLVVEVPEPTAVAYVAIILGGLGIRRRRS